MMAVPGLNQGCHLEIFRGTSEIVTPRKSKGVALLSFSDSRGKPRHRVGHSRAPADLPATLAARWRILQRLELEVCRL